MFQLRYCLPSFSRFVLTIRRTSCRNYQQSSSINIKIALKKLFIIKRNRMIMDIGVCRDDCYGTNIYIHRWLVYVSVVS
jgi:hypothetical protein